MTSKNFPTSASLPDDRPAKPFPLIGVVEDDLATRQTISGVLRSADYRTVVFESAEAFLRWDNKHEIGCLVLDVPQSWLDLQRRLSAMNVQIPVILLVTGNDDSRTRALHDGVEVILPRAVNREALLGAIQSVLTPASCKERMALVESYNAANLLYTRSLSELHHRRGTCSKFVYDNLEREADDLRNGVYRAFADLERHLAEHRCDSMTLHRAAGH